MENKEKSFVSAVIYVHNAQMRLEGFLRTIIKVMESNFEHSEIICVNDFSDDDSLSVIKTVSNDAATTSITVVNMSYYHGLELAMNAGVDMAIGDYVFEFDNTFIDYDPDMIMKVYRHALEGYDIVSASPDRKEKFSSRLFYRTFDRYADIPCNMSTETFRVISRRVINRISSMNKSIFYRKALYANCGLKTDNIRYTIVAKNRSQTDKKEKSYRSGLALDSLLLHGHDFPYDVYVSCCGSLCGDHVYHGQSCRRLDDNDPVPVSLFLWPFRNLDDYYQIPSADPSAGVQKKTVQFREH